MAAASEVFVVVRPPPSKTTNPLNLQVQLLTAALNRPTSRLSGDSNRSPAPSESGASSFDAVAGASVGLKRSPSMRSNRSGASSTASSSATGGAQRRPIIPLYNLEFHNLRETLVTDAGTDAKVAKFLKRGIEIVGLGVLDPVDLPSSAALTPSSSPPAPISHLPPPPQTLEVPTPPPSTGSSFLSKFKRLSFKPPPSLPLKPETSPPLASHGQTVLPLFPEAEPADGMKAGRPKSVISVQGSRRQGYSFVVRKWTRKDLEGPTGAQAATEVRFEWRRARRRGKSSAGQQPGPLSSAASSPEAKHISLPPMDEVQPPRIPSPPTRTASSDYLAPAAAATRSGRASSLSTGDQRPNLSATSSRSPTRSPASSIHHDQDDGYDSDPEDSERPWVCEVVIGPRRLLLGTLRPAPHHPRLVAHLAVPFSLAPVALGGGLADGLSVEEMKDCLSVTGLWVIVRENLGGLSKRRKGKA